MAATEPNALELPKSSLLSGLAPPSHIIDGSPLVEHEANRLQEAMTWVYKSVYQLQEHGPAVDSRLANMQELLKGMADANAAMQLQLATLSSRVIKLEDLGSETQTQVEGRLAEVDKNRAADRRHAEKSIQHVQKDMTALLRYVSGAEEAPQISESTAHAGAKGEWPLAWLEKRIEGLIAGKNGISLETRLQNLEKAGGTDVGNRLKKVEQDFRLIDVQDLNRVRPDLTDFERKQEAISTDLVKEMKELKVIVGCVEACIPRETRKAVQLFKRAAGSADTVEPPSPREFAMEGKILAFKEEMAIQIQDATATLNSGREHMTAIVKGLERKQEILESHLEDVRRTVATPPVPKQQGLAEPLQAVAPVANPETAGARM